MAGRLVFLPGGRLVRTASGAPARRVSRSRVSLTGPGTVIEGNPAAFAIAVTPAASAAIQVSYGTSNGVALDGADYVATSGVVTIPVGATSSTIEVPTIARAGAQSSRAFSLAITAVAPALSALVNPSASVATATIVEVATAGPSVRVAALSSAAEGAPLTFRLSLDAPVDADTTVDYATGNGSAIAGTDYTPATGAATIPAGQVSADVVVSTTDRAGYQGARSFALAISGAMSGGQAVAIATPSATGTIRETMPIPSGGEHDYFNALLTHPNHLRSYSLRPKAGEPITSPHYADMLNGTAQSPPGFVRSGGARSPFVIYDPASDVEPLAQDATRLIRRAWQFNDATLHSPVGPTDTAFRVIRPAGVGSWVTKHLVVGEEVIAIPSAAEAYSQGIKRTVVNHGDGSYTVGGLVRACKGTTAGAYPAGTPLGLSANSLADQVYLPMKAYGSPALGTEDGYDYFVTFEAIYPASTAPTLRGIGGFKEFIFLHSSSDDQWAEQQMNFHGGGAGEGRPPDWNPAIHAGAPTLRTYGQANLSGTDEWATAQSGDAQKRRAGLQVVKNDPALIKLARETTPSLPHSSQANTSSTWDPYVNPFGIKPDVVTRFSYLIEQTPEWCYFSLWVADETRDPVRQYNRLKMPIPYKDNPTSHFVKSFGLRLNTSNNEFVRPFPAGAPALSPDAITYVRNVSILRFPNGVAVDALPLVRP